jgi:hypothetical protein
MREAARVQSVDALGRFRAALIEFQQSARLALSNAEGDIRRTTEWLRHEQLNHWQQQVRRRTRAVAEAKSELYRAELGSRDERPSCAVERRKLEIARQRLAEAEEKIRRVHHWQRMLDREHMQYRGQTASLSGFLERDLPKASARMDRLQRALDAYLRLVAPPSQTTTTAATGPVEEAPDEASSQGDSPGHERNPPETSS